MSYLILGGTGTVGSEVVKGLLARRESVRVLTRSEEKAASLPGGVVGDLLDPSTFERVFSDVDGMFLLNAVTPTELQEGLAAVNEARRAGVRRIVYLSIHDAEKGRHIPHLATKLAVEAAIKDSDIPYTMLRANEFYQNDLWFKDVILGSGIYPQPIGDVGVSRVDVRDIAQTAVNALTQPGHENKTYALVGPEPLTGEACAQAFAEALGREVRYGGNDLDAWQQQAMQMLPGWMVYDLRLTYELCQDRGAVATPDQLKQTETILGGEPRHFRDFVAETVASWR